MTIKPDDPKLTAFVLGELSDDEVKEIAAQVAKSVELQEAVAEIEQAASLLTDQFAMEPQQHLTEVQRKRITEGLDSSEELHYPKNRRRRIAMAAIIGGATIAASLVFYVDYRRQLKLEDGLQTAVPSDMKDAAPKPVGEDAPVAEDERLLGSNVVVSDDLVQQSSEMDLLTTINTSPAAGKSAAKDHSVVRLSDGITSMKSDVMITKVRAAPVDGRGGRAYRVSRRAKGIAMPGVRQGVPTAGRGIGVNFGLEVRDGVEALGQNLEGFDEGRVGDRFDSIVDNAFLAVNNSPLSTFSIDVDTASYSKIRMYLRKHRQLPAAGAVRIEELINYFQYDYEGPQDDKPFASHVEIAACPWNLEHRLVRIGIKGKEIEREARPVSNLVFLLDVSGSMNNPNKLPLVKHGMKRLVDQLGENDRVAIVVYAGAAGLVLPSTTGDQKNAILNAFDELHAGGSTNGGQGIQLAYQTALDNFIPGGTNRVILCTDGDFNVGTTDTSHLVDLVASQAKNNIFLSVLGFGMGNHNDAMLEQISNKGNGNYAFIDNASEANKVLVEQMSGTLVTIAKDVKIQIEFNPAKVSSYRLIGYENRILAAQDFNDDKKDAGEIGAGHTVTALYEIVPANQDKEIGASQVDDLIYQEKADLTDKANSGELMTLKIRYKEPEGDKSKLILNPIPDEAKPFAESSADFQLAAAVASFGMVLRDSEHKGTSTYASVQELANGAVQQKETDYRIEFLELVDIAAAIGDVKIDKPALPAVE